MTDVVTGAPDNLHRCKHCVYLISKRQTDPILNVTSVMLKHIPIHKCRSTCSTTVTIATSGAKNRYEATGQTEAALIVTWNGGSSSCALWVSGLSRLCDYIGHNRSLVGRQLGVSPQGMGFIFAFIPIAGIVVKPFLGGIADK